jgi:hypothetical protein
LNPETAPIDWFPLLLIGTSALVMLYLARRAMRGMNQQDWVLLRQMRSRGVDVRVPQRIAFVVFAANQETAASLAQEMSQEGYETSIKQAQIQFARKRKPGAPQDGWLVSGVRVVPLVPETLITIRKRLTEMANERKSLYLGWQVAEAFAPAAASASPAENAQRHDPAVAQEQRSQQ